jgi:hypothetical protein
LHYIRAVSSPVPFADGNLAFLRRPQIEEIEFEMDLRGVSLERRLPG